MGIVFFLGVLLILAIYMVWAYLRALFTGRKPEIAMVWQQYQAMRKNFGQNGQRPQAQAQTHYPTAPDDQVIDVEAHPVLEATSRKPPSAP